MGLIFNNFQNSIIRRSLGLSIIVLPAYFINFAFLILSGRFLKTEAFGIFYTALSIINILIAPAVITNLFFARRITLAASCSGRDAAYAHFMQYVHYVLIWGGGSCLGLFILLMIAGNIVGVESFIIVLLIPVIIFAIYLAESIRALLQGLKKFIALGGFTIFWTILRFLLGIAGILLVGLPWAGLFGVSAAAILAFLLAFFLIFKPDISRIAGIYNSPGEKDSVKIVSFGLSYGVFVLIMYLDIVAAYFFLDRMDLGFYSEACIMSKSIILFTNPIIQIFFPIIVEQNAKSRIDKNTILKSFLITFLMCGAAAAIVSFFAGFVCEYLLGLNAYNLSVMRGVVVSIIPICLLRILVLVQLAKGYNHHAFLLLPMVIIQVLLLYLLSSKIEFYAWGFGLLCWITFLYYGILVFGADCPILKYLRRTDMNRLNPEKR